MPKTQSAKPHRRHVFVSHSSIDTWVAKQIAREIEDCGATPFLDENDIDVGADFEDRLLESLSMAHELVVLLTPWALLRPYVWAEIGAAWVRRIPIVVLLHGLTISELQARPELPLMLKRRSFVPLNDVDDYFSELRNRVRDNSRRGKAAE
ncbi:MAG TPA: TIR domain-containing protein [Planctomycetaceae bacterium]|nr:TIR domain-containing protein [Planctomycetaceae bacterium]